MNNNLDNDSANHLLPISSNLRHVHALSYFDTEPWGGRLVPPPPPPSTLQQLKRKHELDNSCLCLFNMAYCRVFHIPATSWASGRKCTVSYLVLGHPLKDDDLVFSTLEGRPLHPNTITRAWTKLAASAGVNVIRFHDARHTHASLMLKQGIHPKIVQERLGHASIQMTLDTYGHVSPGLQQSVAESFDKMVAPRHEREAIHNHY